MKYLVLLFCTIFSLQTFATDNHSHHAKHNMVLFGESEIFLSHIVYKVPHNFQVILKIELDEKTKATYLQEKKSNPDDEYIFLLDHMDIKDISTVESISGTISRTDAAGAKTILATNVVLKRSQYKVIYFDELPLSLEQ